ncbi:ribosome biogenesis GTPase Der [Varunaivibrio sulfuroxidans]|uniref:GTPase Der n=1 Tax=Varunaivibrio sulfuroxidans TaxID=1773489 RepID=A0A4R3J6J8_9PROT|nr:ribosome biogenesis GTPase Der [Varunaivibrio sulfuroxidans]TCS61007.1 GTP-binding protein [Varunaivibrio sulfuroxidans]WES31587.1 ribosome biogenesis GTPase Der [Varunaivibrio sulfuroxidans]
MPLTVAIIGRPNVGKSTLFNRLAGKRLAIVDDTPGVTRDRRAAPGRIADLAFTVVDTAGLEEAFDDSLEARMRTQTETAVDQADVGLLLIDARAGVTPMDKHFASWLRKRKTPVILIANKCEGRAGQSGMIEAFELGLGEPIAISAEHGEGMGELYDALRPLHDARREKETWQDKKADAQSHPAPTTAAVNDDRNGKGEAEAPDTLTDDDADGEPRLIQMAIVGRPNVGKSTLINHLIGEDRLLSGPEAGITRDAITIPLHHKGRRVDLVDTAGLRRKAKITEKIEGLSSANTLNAIRFAQVVVLVLDAQDLLEKQDLTIARLVADEGRALIIAVNKWDMVRDKKGALQRLADRLETSLPQVRGVPVVTLSAHTGKGVAALIPKALSVYDAWNTRISTGKLNRWLEITTERHPPPLAKGRRIKVRYMTQVKSRPPTFAVFVSQPEGMPESYLRYLTHALREDFALEGLPIRILMRKGANPYAPD